MLSASRWCKSAGIGAGHGFRNRRTRLRDLPRKKQRQTVAEPTAASGVGRSLGTGDFLESLPDALAGLQAVVDGIEDETADGALLRAGGIADVLCFFF